MAKFIKGLFSISSSSSSSESKKKVSKSKSDLTVEEEPKEVAAPYDTKRKLSISRSGRMKQNLKVRGTLANDLYGEKYQTRVEKTNIEYHVHGKRYLAEGSTAQWTIQTSSEQNLNQYSSNGFSETHKSVATNIKENKRKNQSVDNIDKLEDMDFEIEKAFKLVETSF